ncbi:hypothetical protein Pyn_11802 [Prunus yedoensis var. nudiflora]|uniref:Uncharacterized protein n=1 Tax=Prunus yedoensis var. nudiflora TaxID=2094558 RepID=A0A314Y6Z8_PRUYE|nr:hypothetical protein Pyn_11802 [Prunus yedoensis var. nudiflora]
MPKDCCCHDRLREEQDIANMTKARRSEGTATPQVTQKQVGVTGYFHERAVHLLDVFALDEP